MQRLKISREGIILIKSFEGFRPHAVRRDDGWSIGYGHTLSAREGGVVSEADAELLLQFDLIPVAKALNDGAGPLNQHQFDALASFAFSVGLDRFQSSDVLSRLTAGSTGEAADAIVGWTDPQPIDSPVRRRAAERALFVADPGRPVALAELLSAPLPPPSVPPVVPTFDVAEAFTPDTLSAPESAAEPDQTPVPDDEPAPEPAVETPALPLTFAASRFETSPVVAPFGSDMASTPASLNRYSAYSGNIVGPLPGAAVAVAATALTSPDADIDAPPTTETVAPFPFAEPAEPAPFESSISRDTPDVDGGELLVLTPLDESASVSTQRLVWPHAETGADQSPLFEDDGALRLDAHQMIRHEIVSEEPRRLDWREIGLYVIMSGFGLLTFGMSVAAFRRASQPSGGSDFTTVAWVLAVFGFACIAVSAWNLYRKLDRSED